MLAAQGVAAAPLASACRPTQSDAFGPFERSGAASPRRAKIGTGHVLSGRVLRAPDCKPVAGALVEFWQAGPNGYSNRGRGSVVTDRLGRFRFVGPVPSSYSGGQPHIHVLVSVPGYEELQVRYIVRAGEPSGRVTLVLQSEL